MQLHLMLLEPTTFQILARCTIHFNLATLYSTYGRLWLVMMHCKFSENVTYNGKTNRHLNWISEKQVFLTQNFHHCLVCQCMSPLFSFFSPIISNNKKRNDIHCTHMYCRLVLVPFTFKYDLSQCLQYLSPLNNYKPRVYMYILYEI